jgi:3-oxoacyl-[acyl-carrier protein] reductase
MEGFLSGRRALVVGGSGGIGAAVSAALARHGARLRIHGGHSRQKLETVAARAREHTDDVTTLLLEISGPQDARDLLEFGGQVDILVVSYGPWLQSSVIDTRPDQWEEMVGQNLTLPAVLMSGVLPGMTDRRYGRIVLFGGPRSDRLSGYLRIAGYAAAKHGLASLARSVALQHADDNVRCNMICPGHVETEYYSESRKRAQEARHPSRRLISVEEVASLVVSLLRPDSDAINGAIIPVDFGV